MKKKILSVLLAIMLVISVIPLTGTTSFAATSGDFEYEVLSEEEKTCEITKYNGSASELEIPSQLNGYTVTKIDSSGFSFCTSLISVVIPDSVTNIVPNNIPFYECTTLQNIYVNVDNQKYCDIGGVLFNKYKTELLCYPCGKSDVHYTIPDGVEQMSMLAFGENSVLQSITIPDSFTSDLNGVRALYYLYSLTEIIVCEDNNFYSSKDGVLYNKEQTELIRYPVGRKEINCTIPDGVKSIGEFAFQCYSSLKSIMIPDSVTSIGDYAFYECSSLTDITIPDSVININEHAFEDCIALTNITIPDSVTNIGVRAFSGCTSLTSVIIPDSVSSIGGFAFVNTAYYENKSNWEDGVLYIGNHLIAEDLNDDVVTTYTVKDGTKTIAGYAFYGTSLKSIIIPDSVTNIGYEAFAYSRLTRITIPDDVTIDDRAFGWSDLNNVTIGSKVIICINAFIDCISLESIEISDSVTAIERGAFDGTEYYNNQSNWEDNELYVGNHLIKADASRSGEYTVKQGTKLIADWAFENCESITSVVLPDSVSSIGYCSFWGCRSLANVNLGNGVTNIESLAFEWCESLENIVIPASVTYIDCEAFSHSTFKAIDVHSDNANYSSIDGILFNKDKTELIQYPGKKTAEDIYIVPESVTKIGNFAFCYCNIKGVMLGNNVSSIGEYAFAHSSSLKHITIPSSVNSIGEGAFFSWGSYNLNHIIYSGTQEQWNKISIDNYRNFGLFQATLHCNTSKDQIVTYETTATCTESAYRITKCLVCNEIIYRQFLAGSLGHTKGQVVETVPPTCTSNGYTKYKCSVCGEEYKTDWTYEEHNYSVLLETHDATCTEQGYAVYKCETCDDTVFTYTAEALGHTFSDTDNCTRCGMHKSDCLESNHPYANNMDETWILNKPGAQSVAVTFSSDTYVESGYDYIYIYDATDALIGKYTGKELAGKRIVVSGDTVKIRLTSDSSQTKFGFALSKVETNIVRDIETDGIVVTEGKIGDFTSDTRLKVENLETENGQIKYDISLVRGETVIQPTTPVTVKIPVPATMDGADCKVYREEADGTYTDMNAVCIDGFMVFTTDHFSVYVLTTGNPNGLLGDVNDDGIVDAADAVMIQRYDAGIITLTSEQLSVGDVNGDGIVDAADAVKIQRYDAGLIDTL